jgi:hypothetical protein
MRVPNLAHRTPDSRPPAATRAGTKGLTWAGERAIESRPITARAPATAAAIRSASNVLTACTKQMTLRLHYVTELGLRPVS